MSDSLNDFKLGLKHADRLIEGTKSGRGKPTAQEASMFVASVALTYAAWEAYVEDLAIEATKHLATHIDPDLVPESSRKAIEGKSPSTWELLVHPGWRSLWLEHVELRAKGDQAREDFGMNTAREKQIRGLFRIVGVDFMDKIAPSDRADLEELVDARGEVVHAANAPAAFNKGKAKGYRDLVERMALVADEELRTQVQALIRKEPWPAS